MPTGDMEFTGVTHNVSATGASITVDGEVLQTGLVDIAFEGPDPIVGLSTTARVVWVRGGHSRSQLGVHFLEMEEDARKRLSSAIYGDRSDGAVTASSSSRAYLTP